MKSFRIIKVVLSSALLFSLIVAASSCTKEFKTPSPEALNKLGFRSIPGDRDFPDISFTDINGDIHKLQEYRGSVVLLNFWATWCPPCRAEMPGMGKLAHELKGRDFVMLPLNVQESAVMVQSFVEEFNVDFPVYLDIDAEAAMTVGVSGLPTSILINRDGNAIAAVTGTLKWDSEEIISVMQEWTR